MTQPSLPQPQLAPTGMTLEQYMAYTPEKLELWDGFYDYGRQDLTGFHLAVLTNMGLLAAVREVPLALLLEAIQEVVCQHPKLDLNNEVGAAMLDRLSRGLEELNAVADYLSE
jgi:hypothetical protein